MFPKNKIISTVLKVVLGFLLLCGLMLGAFVMYISIPTPEVTSSKSIDSYKRIALGPNYYQVNNCWLRKNKFGVWEMYLEGTPYERGLIYGILSKELMEKQEVNFVSRINELVPNSFFLQVLKGFVGWFNRDIYKYVPDENLQEIYGVSKSFSDQFDYIGPKYYRILNYHAAHDIGHALADLNMVGCTSFSVRGSYSEDTTLLIGRNFDFYMGDAFAEDKLIVFVNPDKGYKFASYAWAGLTGVVSGMNEKGLTVTLNASKSDIPYGAKDPISLLAREILQYAGSIEAAVSIAKKRDTFVSESLLIGSAADGKSVIIEKSPSKIDVFESGNEVTVCSNHYQGKVFLSDSANISNIRDSDSGYRFARMNELIRRSKPLSIAGAANILRDKNGLEDKFIGFGNSKSLNQLIAHHGILFKPEIRTMWISAPPYQLGTFMAYDLNQFFAKPSGGANIEGLNIPPDPFLYSQEFLNYESFKKIKQRISAYTILGIPFEMSATEEQKFISYNRESYLPYLYLGDYHRKHGEKQLARNYFEQSLSKEVSSENERNSIKTKILELKK